MRCTIHLPVMRELREVLSLGGERWIWGFRGREKMEGGSGGSETLSILLRFPSFLLHWTIGLLYLESPFRHGQVSKGWPLPDSGQVVALGE